MSVQSLVKIKKAVSNLNPQQVRQLADRPLRIAITAHTADGYQRVEEWLLAGLTANRRRESSHFLSRESSPEARPYGLIIYDSEAFAPPNALVFHPDRTHYLVERVLDEYEDLGVALARAFLPFRRPFVERVISRTCKENTFFSLTTALPDVIPNVIELPWAVAEFASDTAFLTMNQLRMAFLIAAASDREVGYREQKSEIATVIASAFGWRALARQVIGKVPFGGGLIAKSAVAYAGTKVLGLSLDRLYSLGYAYSREERQNLYAEALQHGRSVAFRILSYFRPDLASKYSAEDVKGSGTARARSAQAS